MRLPRDGHVSVSCAALLVAAGLVVIGSAQPAEAGTSRLANTVATAADEVDLAALGWIWPARGSVLTRPFVAPAHAYGPGHRGIDLELLGDGLLHAPADGVIAFSGSVAGRGILTIDHGNGLVTTLEPVETVLKPGASVRRGMEVATLSAGGHAPPGAVHFGVRRDGQYINPMLLLGGVPRAILLPCCD